MDEILPLVAPLIVLSLIMLLVMWPQHRKRRRHARLLASLVPGQVVAVTGGIRGRITRLTATTVTLEIAPGTEIDVERAAIQSVVETAPAVVARARTAPPPPQACPRCGAPFQSGDRFCSRCGERRSH